MCDGGATSIKVIVHKHTQERQGQACVLIKWVLIGGRGLGANWCVSWTGKGGEGVGLNAAGVTVGKRVGISITRLLSAFICL